MISWIEKYKKSRKVNNLYDIFELHKRYCGSLNRDKIVYHIYEANENLGFFAMFRYWLEYIYFADVCGYIPVIEASSNFAYSDKRENCNAFESYFEQPRLSVHDAKRSRGVISSSIRHREMVELILTGKSNHYQYTKNYLYLMSKIVSKYIKFNENTWHYIENSIEGLGIKEKKVLGVHIRGTDFRAQYDNHPVYVKEEDVFKKIEERGENHYDKIFLATDDSRILNNFKNKYGDKLCFYDDVMRGNRNKSVIFVNNNKEGSDKHRLGLEVIRDMYTLALCDGLVAGISQVAICSQIYKLSMKKKYEELVIIDKGINYNGRIFRR